jgi:hypothetical protein
MLPAAVLALGDRTLTETWQGQKAAGQENPERRTRTICKIPLNGAKRISWIVFEGGLLTYDTTKT